MELVDKCLEAAFQSTQLGNEGGVSKTESFIQIGQTNGYVCAREKEILTQEQ